MSNDEILERTIDKLHRETGIPMWALDVAFELLDVAFELLTLGMLDEETIAGARVVSDAARIIADLTRRDLAGGAVPQSVASREGWTSIDSWLRDNPNATAAQCLAELVERIKIETTPALASEAGPQHCDIPGCLICETERVPSDAAVAAARNVVGPLNGDIECPWCSVHPHCDPCTSRCQQARDGKQKHEARIAEVATIISRHFPSPVVLSAEAGEQITAGCAIDRPVISVDCGRCKGTGRVAAPSLPADETE